MTYDRMLNLALFMLYEAVKRGRRLHPRFAEGSAHALGEIHAEYLELEQAITTGEGLYRERAEALDLAVCAVRFYMGEHLHADAE